MSRVLETMQTNNAGRRRKLRHGTEGSRNQVYHMDEELAVYQGFYFMWYTWFLEPSVPCL